MKAASGITGVALTILCCLSCQPGASQAQVHLSQTTQATPQLMQDNTFLKTLSGNWQRQISTPDCLTGRGEILSFDYNGNFIHARYSLCEPNGDQASTGHARLTLHPDASLAADLIESSTRISAETQISSTSAEGNSFGGTLMLLGSNNLFIDMPEQPGHHYQRLPNIKDSPQGAWLVGNLASSPDSPNSCIMRRNARPDFGDGSYCTVLYLHDNLLLILNLKTEALIPDQIALNNGIFKHRIGQDSDVATLLRDNETLAQAEARPVRLSMHFVDSQRHDKTRNLILSETPDVLFPLARLLSYEERKTSFSHP